MEKKTHFRKVFKSDHLGCADLEEFIEEKKELQYTIKEVKQELGVMVAGRRGDFNVAYFVEAIKPLVLNATNCAIIKKLSGGSPFIENWKNIPVELFIDESVRMKGEVVGGVRLRAPSLSFDSLKKTFEEKKEKLPQKISEAGSRILANKERESYTKLFNELKKY
jgi:hypothetical protein